MRCIGLFACILCCLSSLAGSLTRSLARSLARWLAGSLARWLAGSLALWLTGSLARWLAGPLDPTFNPRYRSGYRLAIGKSVRSGSVGIGGCCSLWGAQDANTSKNASIDHAGTSVNLLAFRYR